MKFLYFTIGEINNSNVWTFVHSNEEMALFDQFETGACAGLVLESVQFVSVLHLFVFRTDHSTNSLHCCFDLFLDRQLMLFYVVNINNN